MSLSEEELLANELSPLQGAIEEELDEEYNDPSLRIDDTPSGLYDSEGNPLYEHFRCVVDPGQSPVRVDKFLTDRMNGTSRNRIQQAADAGFIFINDKRVKSNTKVKPCDVITLQMRRPRKHLAIIAEDIPLEVVYEDEVLMVINKPAGMVVHPGFGNYTGTLVNALAYYLQEDPLYDPEDPNVGLVHRIDKDTSGLLVVAKRPEAKAHLARQFFEKTTHRSYRALVWGRFDAPEGTVRGNIGRDSTDRLQMSVYPEGSDKGKPAVTHYTVLEELAYVSWIECRLETGRTHQIRAHMRHIGHTLFGDERYGGDRALWGNQFSKYKQFVDNCLKLCPRQALHAKTLGFTHPTTGEYMSFDSELPNDLEQLLERWRTYAAQVDER
ncbi:MAG: RluA family pseudouridine synthase [Porphyromonas sp.]|nr:RluA family pseudouridine synthase [Porphyromonas sp.]